MKRFIVACAAVLAVAFGMSGCVSNTAPAFGEESASSVKGVSVYTDVYSGNRTFEYTAGLHGKGFALSRGFSADYLHFYPAMVVSESGLCTPNLEIRYTGTGGGLLSTGADKTYNRFIFMDEHGKKLEIVHTKERNLDSDSDVAVGGGAVIVSTHYDGTYQLLLTKSQFDGFNRFFSNAEKVSCAAYSTDSKVVTFSSYNKKWHMNCFKALDEAVKADVPNAVYNQTVTNAFVEER